MRAKIIKAFLTVISILLISEIFFIASHYLIARQYRQTVDQLISEYQLTESTSKMVNSFYDLIQYSNDQTRLQAFKSSQSDLQTLLAKMDKTLSNNDNWTVYLGVKNTVNGVISEVNKGFNNITVGNFSEVTASYLKAANENAFVKDNVGVLILNELSNVEKTQNSMNTMELWSEIIGLSLFALVIAGSLIYAIFFSKKLIDPLFRLAQASKRISSGNYAEKIDEDAKNGNTEIATLAESLESIANILREGSKKLESKDAQLAQTIKNLTGQENGGAAQPPTPTA